LRRNGEVSSGVGQRNVMTPWPPRPVAGRLGLARQSNWWRSRRRALSLGRPTRRSLRIQNGRTRADSGAL